MLMNYAKNNNLINGLEILMSIIATRSPAEPTANKDWEKEPKEKKWLK